MHKLSNGEDSTLEAYRKIAIALFGRNSKAVEFIDKKILESPNKEKEEVMANETQMFHVLYSINSEN